MSKQGEISFEAGGDRHVLKIDINSLARIEDECDVQSALDVFERLEKRPSFRDLRVVLWALLQEDLSIDEAGELAGELGIERVVELIAKAVEAAFPSNQPGKPRKRK